MTDIKNIAEEGKDDWSELRNKWELELKQIHLEPGDAFILKVKGSGDTKIPQAFYDYVNDWADTELPGIQLLVLHVTDKNDIDITTLTEEDMAKLGWFRKDASKNKEEKREITEIDEINTGL